MFRLINSLKNKKGFTLIELIVVLAVLAIIMAIAVPRFLGVQTQAKIDADVSTLGLIAKTTELYYAQDKMGSGTGKYGDYSATAGTTLTTALVTALQKDIPDIKFQSTSSTLTAVKLYIDDNGVAEVTLGSLAYPK